MSVQAGIWNFAGEPTNRELLARISQAIAEYGPDGETTYFDGGVGMLYRPFHTTLESRVERQPHVCISGKVITWDGRLDNRHELIPQLRDHLTDDQTDVAVVAAAFDRWDTECFARLIGDWALAVWDPNSKELIAARDYMGIRHLFYYPTAKRTIWCSHLAPLALCGDRFSLCDKYIAGYLAFHPDAGLTPYREIHSVPPGTFVRIRDGKSTVRAYWNFNCRLKTQYKTDEEYEEQYRYLFRQSVRRRLRTDSPILAELSGGLDSSSMVCMADDIIANAAAEAPRLDTFSYYDSNEPGEDDLAHITKVEEKRGRSGLRVDLKGSGDSLAMEYLTFSATPGFGSRREVKVAMAEVAKRREYRVMLCGTGGDEINGQALDPRIQMADLLVHFRFFKLAKELASWSPHMRRPWIQLFVQTLVQILPVSIRARLTPTGKLEPWINPKFARLYRMSGHQLGDVDGIWFPPSVRDSMQTIAALSRVMTYTGPSLVEQRYPYLDQTLVEFLTTIPLNQLIRPGQRRFLMRKALAGLLPREIATRRTKARPGRCYSVALNKHWSKVESAFHSPLSSRLGYVDRDRIYASLLAMKNGMISPYFLRLLKAFSLELWLRDAEARGIISIQPSVSRKVRAGFVESRA